MPETHMRAVVIRQFGGTEVLAVDRVPVPEPGAEQLLVRVKASALNRADTLQRQGLYPPPPGESDILGLELAGDVAAWGSGVRGFSKGDRVFGLVGGGGYAEYALLDHQMAMPIPQGWSYENATAVPEVFFTSNETLFVLGELAEGQSVLIHAGGSGVGTAGIQMAAQAGAKVFFTAGSAEKITRAEALGGGAAICGINYKSQDFQKEVTQLTSGEGVDVVLDFIGADYLERNLAILKPGGRLILAATMGGAKGELDLGIVLRKRLQVIGSVMRSRPLEDKRAITRRFRERWLPLLTEGRIRPIVDTVFPMEQVREAHEYMEANHNFGKIVLTMKLPTFKGKGLQPGVDLDDSAALLDSMDRADDSP
jgi:putative PIG3 family NAD(P)H quinone oxidoreductase